VRFIFRYVVANAVLIRTGSARLQMFVRNGIDDIAIDLFIERPPV